MKLPPDIVTHTHRGMRLLALAACMFMVAAPGMTQNAIKSTSAYQNYVFKSEAEKQSALAYVNKAISEEKKLQSFYHAKGGDQSIKDLEDTRRHILSCPVKSGGGGSAAGGHNGRESALLMAEYQKQLQAFQQSQAALQAYMEKARKDVQAQLQKDRAHYQQKTAEGVKALNKASSSALSELDALDAANASPSRARAPRLPSEAEQSLDIYARSSSDALNSLVGNGDLTRTADPGSQPPELMDSAQLALDVTQPDKFTPLSPDSLLPPDKNTDGTSSLRDYGGFDPKADGDKDMPASPDGTSPDATDGKAGNATTPGKDKPLDPQQGLPGSAASPDGSTPAAGMKAGDTPAADGTLKDPQQTAQTAPRDFDSLTPKEQTEINRRTDELWAKKNGLPPGTKIDPQADPEAAKQWLAQRQEVLQGGSQPPPPAAVPSGTTPAPQPQADSADQPTSAQPTATVTDGTPATPSSSAGAAMAPAQPPAIENADEPAAAASPAASSQLPLNVGGSNSIGPMRIENSLGLDSTGSSSSTTSLSVNNQQGDTIASGYVKNTNGEDGSMGTQATIQMRGGEFTYAQQYNPGGIMTTNTEVTLPIGTATNITLGGGTTADGGRQLSAGAGIGASYTTEGGIDLGANLSFKTTATSTPVNSTNDPMGNYLPGSNKSVTITTDITLEGSASVSGLGAKASYGIQDVQTISRGTTTAHETTSYDVNYETIEATMKERENDPEFLMLVSRMTENTKAEYARTHDPATLRKVENYTFIRDQVENAQKGTPRYKEFMRQQCIENAQALEANPRFSSDSYLQQQAIDFRQQALLFARELQQR